MTKLLISITTVMVLLFSATSLAAQDEDVKAEIETLIQKIRSITIEEIQPQIPEEDEPTTIDLTLDPNSIDTSIDPADPNENDAEPQPQALDIDTIIKTKSDIENPFQLAELLYANKRYESAYQCYQKALEQLTDNPKSNNDKVWIMVQMGNCQKYTKPDKAIETYNIVLKNHPLSIWANYASVQIELSKWYLKDKPKQLIVN